MKIVKKDKTVEDYDEQKIIVACNKAAKRAMVKLTDDDYSAILNAVWQTIQENYEEDVDIHVYDMHNIVEAVLGELYPNVGKMYKEYRNYKKDFIHMMDDVYEKSKSIMYIGDRSNANTDSSLVATKRSIISNELFTKLYEKFFLTKAEKEAAKYGYIYIHDKNARDFTVNCCLFRVGEVLKGGFEMGNVWYNEPKTLDTAFDVIGDIVLSGASQQYGGFTIPEIDKILAPYAEKSYWMYIEEYESIAMNWSQDTDFGYAPHAYAMEKVKRDMEQGFQGLEYKFNTVGSSRGDYPFVAITLGLATDEFGKLAAKTALKVHMNGHGKEGFKKPVLFPKIIFLYDKELHGIGKENEDVFEVGLECSSKTMYPDWLSLTGEGYVAEMYKKYKTVVSPMG